MIWFLVLLLLALGVLMIVLTRNVGLVFAIPIVSTVVALYGYPTSGWFLPNDFYLLGIHGNSVWIEEDGAPGPRAIALHEVPEEWTAALEGQSGHPVRIKRLEQEDEEVKPFFGIPPLEGVLAPDVSELRVIKAYRMQKP